MSASVKIIIEDSIGLISLFFAFKAIKCPICPVDISLLQISYQILPWDVSTVVAVFS